MMIMDGKNAHQADDDDLGIHVIHGIKAADSRARDRQISRRFGKPRNNNKEALIPSTSNSRSADCWNDEATANMTKESVRAILAPPCKKSAHQQHSSSSKLGLISPTSSSLAATQSKSSSADVAASAAISLNEVMERTDLLANKNNSITTFTSSRFSTTHKPLLCGGRRGSSDLLMAESNQQATSVLLKLQESAAARHCGGGASSFLHGFDAGAMSGIQRELIGNHKMTKFGNNGNKMSSVVGGPSRNVFRGRAVVREILQLSNPTMNYRRQHAGKDEQEDIDHHSYSAANAVQDDETSQQQQQQQQPLSEDPSADSDFVSNHVGSALAGGKSAGGSNQSSSRQTEPKTIGGSMRKSVGRDGQARTPSGESVATAADAQDYETNEEEGDDEYTGPDPEIRFEDMLYLWDLNRDTKNLVHSRIRDLGMPKFLGMGIANKGNVAPEILLPDPGPVSTVEAKLRAKIERPSFMESRWK